MMQEAYGHKQLKVLIFTSRNDKGICCNSLRDRKRKSSHKEYYGNKRRKGSHRSFGSLRCYSKDRGSGLCYLGTNNNKVCAKSATRSYHDDSNRDLRLG